MAKSPSKEESLDRFVRMAEVTRLCGVPAVSIQYLIQSGQFPLPYRVSVRAKAWRLSELVAWMDRRPRVDTPEGAHLPKNLASLHDGRRKRQNAALLKATGAEGDG
jgi:predicted DNA-binding transcriptional regulator AlpA